MFAVGFDVQNQDILAELDIIMHNHTIIYDKLYINDTVNISLLEPCTPEHWSGISD
jgi:hypothetical protein